MCNKTSRNRLVPPSLDGPSYSLISSPNSLLPEEHILSPPQTPFSSLLPSDLPLPSFLFLQRLTLQPRLALNLWFPCLSLPLLGLQLYVAMMSCTWHDFSCLPVFFPPSLPLFLSLFPSPLPFSSFSYSLPPPPSVWDSFSLCSPGWLGSLNLPALTFLPVFWDTDIQHRFWSLGVDVVLVE